MDKFKILCVDDEELILNGIATIIKRDYEVILNTSPVKALEFIKENNDISVVLSDMKMPEMNGVEFLSKVKEVSPDTTRILLTGFADIETAISIINKSQIFRFLTKPCPPDELKGSIEAAVNQYRLVIAEKILLEKTLQGAIKALVDTLAITSPISFGKALRIKRTAVAIANELKLKKIWQIESAALFSQLGTITLKEELIKKYYSDMPLNEDERLQIEKTYSVTDNILSSIPKLEEVREILKKYFYYKCKKSDSEVDIFAQILKISDEFDNIEYIGKTPELAIEIIAGKTDFFDENIINALSKVIGIKLSENKIVELPIEELKPGMILADDILLNTGIPLVTRGFEVNETFIEKIRNYEPGLINNRIRVFVKK